MSVCTIKINHMLEKIRTLGKQCDISSLTSKIPAHDHPKFEKILDQYLKALDELRIKFYEYHQIVEEYRKLEEVLQKNQTEIRKHVGIQQQLKLYIDTLKAQYEESEADRLELLDNSKAMIKSLKNQNQKLYARMKELENHKLHTRDKFSSQKKIPTHQRVKTDHFLSVYDNHRLLTDGQFNSPSKKKKNQLAEFKVELTDRQNKDISHKKKMFEIKKNKLQNYTVLAYSNPQKKLTSRDKNLQKKTLGTLNDTKKTGNTSGFKPYNRSNKKVNKSVFSLPNSEFDEDFSNRKQLFEAEHPIKQFGPNAFYFSPQNLQTNK